MLTNFKYQFDSGSAVPKYRQFADALAEYLTGGDVPPGSKLPNDRALAAKYGIAVVTMSKALGVLAKRGILERRIGAGTFVSLQTPKNGYRIGLVCHETISLDQGFVSALWDELFRQAPQYNVDLLTLKRSPKEYLRAVKSYRLDGLIVLSAKKEFMPELYNFVAHGMNLVQVGMFHKDYPDISFGTDHEHSASEIVRYLAGLGHRKIGFIKLLIHGSAHISTGKRIYGYMSAMYKNSLPLNPDWIIECDSDMKQLAEAVYRLHDLKELPSAFILDSIRFAPIVYHIMRTLDLNIPQDISLISFDNAALCGQLQPGLTTYGHDAGLLVTKVFDHLCCKRNHDSKPIDAVLTERGSCAVVTTV